MKIKLPKRKPMIQKDYERDYITAGAWGRIKKGPELESVGISCRLPIL